MPNFFGNCFFKNRIMIFLLMVADFFLKVFPIFRTRPIPSNINKILLIKPDHLGDMVITLRLLPLIRGHYPDAHITMLCGSWNLQVLNGNKFIDQVMTLDHFKHNRKRISFFKKIVIHFNDLTRVFRRLIKDSYDVAICLRSSGFNLLPLARFARSKYVIGFKEAGMGAMADFSPCWQPGMHELQYLLSLLSPLGINPASDFKLLMGEIFVSNSDKNKVEDFLKSHGLSEFVVIHAGSGDPYRKQLSFDMWLDIASNIKYPIIFCGLDSETALYDDLRNSLSNEIYSALSLFSLAQLQFLFSKSKEVVCLDSVSGHLAAACGVRCTSYFRKEFKCEFQINQWCPAGENVVIKVV